LKRSSLGRESDGLTAALDAILEQLQRRRGFYSHPQNPRTAPAGERSELTQPQSQGPRPGGSKAERFDDHIQPFGSYFTEELERHVQSFIVHPAYRPAFVTQLTKELEDLAPRWIRNWYSGKEPHQ
jgi:hypothetical protein